MYFKKIFCKKINILNKNMHKLYIHDVCNICTPRMNFYISLKSYIYSVCINVNERISLVFWHVTLKCMLVYGPHDGPRYNFIFILLGLGFALDGKTHTEIYLIGSNYFNIIPIVWTHFFKYIDISPLYPNAPHVKKKI